MTRFLSLASLAIALCLPLAACFDVDDTAACTPAGSNVPAGVYGGDHYQLTINPDGSAELLGDCSRATVDQTPIVDGVGQWTLAWQSGYGLPVQDSGAVQTIDVTFDVHLCATTVSGTLTFPDGTTSPVAVVLGQQANIYACE